MAQVNWVYLDDRGGRHRVGVYHGDRTGHLLIHCNNKIIQIDFSVVNPKTYSFFIEDEFCEIIIDRMKNGGFGYEFRVNKTIDTPRNRIRRIDNRRNNKYLALLIGGVVLTIGILVFGLILYGRGQDQNRMNRTGIVHNLDRKGLQKLSSQGKAGTGRLYIEQINGKQIGVYAFRTADSTEIRGQFHIPANGPVILANGFPLRPGDAFEAIYLPSDPQVHRIDLFRPTRQTIERYIGEALDVEIQQNPSVIREKSLCKILTTAEMFQWTSLANFIFQTKTPAENAKYNLETYQQLLSNPDLVVALEKECKSEE